MADMGRTNFLSPRALELTQMYLPMYKQVAAALHQRASNGAGEKMRSRQPQNHLFSTSALVGIPLVLIPGDTREKYYNYSKLHFINYIPHFVF